MKLNELSKSELWGKTSLFLAKSTSNLNTNDYQEIEPKAHLQ